ncbi:MAG: hypothetical protein RLY31_856 [Bacteroidota bacterium]|jgi:aldehyde dehydrogenase (NAD+)
MEPVPTPSTPLDASQLTAIFERQSAHYLRVGTTDTRQRLRKLDSLHQAVLRHRPAIKSAMWADFRKPPLEVDAVEVFPLTSAIRHTRRHLHRWMTPKRVPTPLAFTGSSSWIQYEPKGCCLIISPWNFPFNLSFLPLISAVAAGNCVILKPSEKTPHSSALIAKIVSEVFDPSEVTVVEGEADTAKALLELPFHHIFFTGSPGIGRLVMQAASRHLASVTLELGGKSPTIVDETADIPLAAERTARAKFANCGQICVAPDYILVHEKVAERFLDHLRAALADSYGSQPGQSGSLAHLVNEAHAQRIRHLLRDALSKGARCYHGGDVPDGQSFVSPTILTQVPENALVLQEEIFGPLLPVLPFRDLSDAIRFINNRERPLTMSIFSRNRRTVRTLLQQTRAGGSCINHAQLHYFIPDLPFGGVNGSGSGKAHGWHGFESFSNARAIYRQHTWGPTELFKPPYTAFKQRIMDLTIKWL